MKSEKEMVNEILSQSLVESVDTGGVVWKMPSPCYFKLFAWNAPRHMNPYEVGIFGIVCTKGSQKKKVHHFHTLPGKKTYPTNGRKLSSGRAISNIFCRLVFWFLRFVGSIFVVLLVWRSPFCFFFQRHEGIFLKDGPPVRHPPSLIRDQNWGCNL